MGLPDRNSQHYKNDGHVYLVDFLSGITQEEIAKKYNTTRKAVESLIRRRRIPNGISITIEELKEKFMSGMTMKEIAKSIGTNVWALDRYFRFNNIDGLMWMECRAQKISGKEFTPELAKKLYLEEKWPTLKIANEFGFVGDDPIRARLRKWGIRIRRDGEHAIKHDNPELMAETLRDHETLKVRYENGESTYEIGDSLGLGEGPVRRALNRVGVKLEGWTKFAHKRKIGKPHESFIKLLDNLGIEHNTQHIVELPFRDGKLRKLEFDECLPQHKLLIEINGRYFHGKYDRAVNNKSVRHKMWTDAFKTQAVYDNMGGWYLLHIWDDEVNTFSLDSIAGTIDASPFGNYRTILKAKEQCIQLKVEVYKEEGALRPIYTTLRIS